MTQNNTRTLLDHWLWEKPMLRVFVFAAIAIPLFISLVLLMTIGQQGLHVLWFMGFAPVFGFGFGFVGKKIARITDGVPHGAGVVIPAKIVRGKIEAAGVVVLQQESLVFLPIVGKRSTVELSAVSAVREVSVFNGSVLWGKTGFWLSTSDHTRLGCAIPKSYAEQFRTGLDFKA